MGFQLTLASRVAMMALHKSAINSAASYNIEIIKHRFEVTSSAMSWFSVSKNTINAFESLLTPAVQTHLPVRCLLRGLCIHKTGTSSQGYEQGVLRVATIRSGWSRTWHESLFKDFTVESFNVLCDRRRIERSRVSGGAFDKAAEKAC